MKKTYEKPVFTKVIYVSMDNMAEYGPASNDVDVVIFIGVEDPCNCTRCYVPNGMCVTEAPCPSNC